MKENIHDLIKEKFGANIHHDERWLGKGGGAPEKFEQDQFKLEEIPESASPYYSEIPSDEEDAQLRSIKQALPLLTEKQREVIQLCGSEGLSLQAAADKLGVTKSAVQGILVATLISGGAKGWIRP